MQPHEIFLSIIIPFHNEEENIPLLQKQLYDVLATSGVNYEIILVNDGSTDKSAQAIQPMPGTQVISLRRQMGKGSALNMGVQQAQGNVVVFMDADLEDDPALLPNFIGKIQEGYEFVNGIRQGRKHSGIIKLYSGVANWFVRNFLKSPFTDINCGYKAMRSTVLDEIPLYGNNFRFFPLAAFYEGFKVTEIPVPHKQRQYGKSKFGVSKIFIGLFDTVTAYFIYQFAERPLHFFGTIGAALTSIGTVIMLYLGYERLIMGTLIYRRPILFVGMLLIIVGVQIGATGLIGELMVYLKKKKNR